MSDRVADYRGLVESLAEKLANSDATAGAEYDDLVQEGLITVWQALQRGIPVSGEIITDRMLTWIQYQRRQRRGEVGSYETLLPLDDYRVVQLQE
jgi:DNA-directed RNA polymerase specialized sigma24 family protein